MDTERTQIEIGFFVRWLLASAVGFGVGAILAMLTLVYLPDLGTQAGYGICFGIVFGAAGGLAQWLIMRRRISGVALWAPATALSFAAAMGIALGIGAQRASDSIARILLFGAVFGVIGGLLQWLILRKHAVGIGWWLGANLVGSLLGVVLGLPASSALDSWARYPAATFIGILFGFGAALGIGLALPTGGGLTWLLRHPKVGPGAEAAAQ